MPSQNESKRRPVDALFGESSAPSPGYVVEPPQPPTTVSPPPPEQIAAPAPAPLPPRPTPSTVTPPPATSRAPTFDPEPAVAAAPPAPPDRISQLYDEVKKQLGDSRVVANECMGLLLKAREAYTKQDFAAAEFYAESAEVRMKRSVLSQRAAHRPIVWVMWLWNLAMLFAGLLSVAVTYILNLTLFGLAVAPAAIVLMRAMSWGVIGGVLGALTQMVWSIRRRDYDPASDASYFARPLVGAILGGVLFVLSQAGVLAGNIDIGDVHIGPIFLYVFAVLVGFGQDSVLDSFRHLFKTIFRAQKP
jgi:hypothetical protein